MSVTWSEVEDRTPDGVQPRSWDQTHTLKAGLSMQTGPWNISLAGEAHSGWPATILSATPPGVPLGAPGLQLSVSERNSRNHSSFVGVDARISRDFTVARGELTAFLEVRNLLDRTNPCCTEYSVDADGSLAAKQTNWLPLIPSLGVSWRF